jgi:2'-5' RNA ligase
MRWHANATSRQSTSPTSAAISWFASSKATVIWAGITRGQEHLFQLAEIADERALDAGIAGEERPFRPHLTLSRVRPQASATDLVDEAELDVGWRVSQLVLFRTLPGRGTVRYEPLEMFSLSR